MARGVRSNASLLPVFSPNLQPQSLASYDPKTRRNTILIAEIVPTIFDAGTRSLGIPADRYYAAFGALKSSSQLPEWMAASGGTLTFGNWDATDKRFYLQLDASASIGNPPSFPGFIYPTGPFGEATSYAPKNVSVTSVSIKTRARFPLNTDYTVYGVGAGTGNASLQEAAEHALQITRNAGVWELGSTDGSTASQSSGGSADGNFHDFHILWSATEAALYVDDVLTVTKSTNLPTEPLTPYALTLADNIDIVDYLVEWNT